MLCLSWNLNFRRNLLDSEIEDLEGLMRSLDDLYLSPSDFPLKFVWNSQVPFKVKSFVCMGNQQIVFSSLFLDDWVVAQRGIVLWQAASIALIRVVWWERNARIFENKARNSEFIWDSIVFLASLWAFCSKAFKGTPLNVIQLDWIVKGSPCGSLSLVGSLRWKGDGVTVNEFKGGMGSGCWDLMAEEGGWNPRFSKPFNDWEVEVVESALETRSAVSILKNIIWSPCVPTKLCRMDSLLYLLVYPQRPLLTTRTIELVGYDKLGAGQNATVAVMSYSGYDIEDAIVMNKSSLDRGFGRCIVMKKFSAVNQRYENNASDRIVRPLKVGHDAERMQILDDDGLAAPGEIIKPNDIYINKESPIITKGPLISPVGLPDSAYKPSRQTFKGPEGEASVVDRVALCSDKNSNLCIKFLIRHTRRPEVGDKFSSRHGQKGVCGTIIQQEDFPFSERGICPDLIMNPHGFPR
ncbi:DNA-directed RNA polymerase III subunit 2 [Vitis vinifera]|uniref:DNA-directed RNA polymerase n=1 Tax=Vitis vinifera TaxID=29760 RepID=A0A438IJR3_VITVI|nr:DNA-directed RNA polymerase III subunit 2 [Vitis vinifera]